MMERCTWMGTAVSVLLFFKCLYRDVSTPMTLDSSLYGSQYNITV